MQFTEFTSRMSSAKRILGITGVLMVLMLVGLVAASPASACTLDLYRGKDYAGSLDATAVKGTLRTPLAASDVYGFGAGLPSAGDVYLINANTGGFVQVGWYVGSAPGLPLANTPRIFYGENDGSGGEVLRAGLVVGWDSFHNYSVKAAATPDVYDFYIDLAYTTSSVHHHSNLYAAGHIGEVDSDCTQMAARAYDPGPTRTLRYRDAGGTWQYIQDHYWVGAPWLISVSAGDIATNFTGG